MTLSELPIKIQDKLRAERLLLHEKWRENTAYRISFANKAGTRYFTAVRVQSAWNDNKGHYMPYGGGSEWKITYGIILWDWQTEPFGEKSYHWVRSRKTFDARNGVKIPKTLKSKKEVLALVKQLEIFDI